jgi:hypothetical protein
MSRFTAPNSNRPAWALLLLLGLSAFFLSPLFRIGYFSDDAISSLLPGVLKVEGYTLPEYIGAITMHCIRGGRFYPLQMVVLNSWFYVVQTPAVHKAMVIAGVVLDLVLFFVLVRRVGKDAAFATFATCLVFPLFQFRAFFDPILSFFGLFQLIIAGVLASLLALQVYLDTNNTRWLVLSFAAYLAAMLMYELSYPLFLLHLVLIGYGRRAWGERVLASLPFIVVGGLGFLSSAVLRWLYVSDNSFLLEMNKINKDPLAFLATLARQTSSAFPLSYYFVNDAGLYPHVWDIGSVVKFMATAGGVTVLAGTLAACLASLRYLPTEADGRPAGRITPLALLGLLLGVLPAVLISVSVRHQKMIRLGIGYTPVYLQYFGIGLLLATGAWSLLSAMSPGGSLRRRARIATAILVAVIAGLTYRANSVLVDALEKPQRSPGFNPVVGNAGACWNRQRQNLESALRAGLVENIPEHAVVHLANEYPGWYDRAHSRYFFAMYGTKVLETIPLTSTWGPGGGWFLTKGGNRPSNPAPATALFLVRDVCLGKKAGYVVLSQDGTADRSRRPQPGEANGSGEIRLFVRHPKLFHDGPTPAFLLFGEAPASEMGVAGQRIVRRGGELTMVRSGRDWGLFSLRSHEWNVDPKSFTLAFGAVSASWEAGLFGPEGGGQKSFDKRILR